MAMGGAVLVPGHPPYCTVHDGGLCVCGVAKKVGDGRVVLGVDPSNPSVIMVTFGPLTLDGREVAVFSGPRALGRAEAFAGAFYGVWDDVGGLVRPLGSVERVAAEDVGPKLLARDGAVIDRGKVWTAVEDHWGNMASAAWRLGCDPDALEGFVQSDQALASKLDGLVRKRDEMPELALLRSIQDRDIEAIKFAVARADRQFEDRKFEALTGIARNEAAPAAEELDLVETIIVDVGRHYPQRAAQLLGKMAAELGLKVEPAAASTLKPGDADPRAQAAAAGSRPEVWHFRVTETTQIDTPSLWMIYVRRPNYTPSQYTGGKLLPDDLLRFERMTDGWIPTKLSDLPISFADIKGRGLSPLVE